MKRLKILIKGKLLQNYEGGEQPFLYASHLLVIMHIAIKFHHMGLISLTWLLCNGTILIQNWSNSNEIFSFSHFATFSNRGQLVWSLYIYF